MALRYLSLGLIFSLSFCDGGVIAGPLKPTSLDLLIGEWDVAIKYANGAEAAGTRTCGRAVGGVYIRCETSVVFSNDAATPQTIRKLSQFQCSAGRL